MNPLPITSPEERDQALGMLGRIARTHLTGNVSPEQEAESRRRFRANLARLPLGQNRGRKTKVWAAGFALAAVVAGIFATRPLWRHPELTFDVDVPIVAQHDYLFVPNTSPSGHVSFSDGSRLTLAPGGRSRIAALHANGAEISIEDGRANFEVVHRNKTHWTVAAGPFAILVTGTAFDVRWSGADELFEVEMHSGSVKISGPLAAAGIELAAGQKLIADLRASQLRIERVAEDAEEDPSTAAPIIENASEPLTVNRRPRRHAKEKERDDSARARTPRVEATEEVAKSWSQRVASGDFRSVLADAEQRGITTVLAQSPLPELVALADAARYAGRVDVAHRALAAQRDRFAGSTAAHTAAFLLGRLADTGEGQPSAAIGWYDRYLAETPNGEFASEALGRKLIAVQRVSGTVSARPIAREYLRRFPQGPYAAKARELTLVP
jgi:hypothetical protein